MADDDEYVRRGRELLSGGTTVAPGADEDPYVTRGRTILAAPTVTQTGPATQVPEPGQSWSWGGMARQIAGAGPRIGANVANVLSDPFANLIGYPLTVAGQTAYDFVAPHLGWNRLSDDERNALYADFHDQPGQRGAKMVGQTVEAITGPSGLNMLAPGMPDPWNLPGTPIEKGVGTVVEGVGTAGLLGPKGPAAPIAGGVGAGTGEVAASYADDWLKPGATLAGNVAGAKTGQVATNVGTKAVGAATGARTPVAAAYDELNIDRTLLGDVSGGATSRLVQAYGSKSPFGSSVVSPVEQKVVGQFNDAVQTTARRLGNSTSEQTAGEVLQKEARNWRDVVFPQKQAQAWAPVDQLLGGEAVAPSNYRTALTALTNKLQALPETALALLPAKTRALLDAINADVPAGQAMTWQQAQNLRSAIGQVMGVPEIVQSVGKDQLTKAYGGISQDMRDTAAALDARNSTPGAVSTAATDAFTNANKVSTDGHAFIDNTLSRIIRSNNPAQETIAPEKAASSILGSGDTTLEALRREIPAAVDELAAYKLRDMALATPGRAGATGQQTSVATFLTDLNRLRQENPAGFRALFSDPAVARKIEALAIVADTMKETASRANTSGTGPYMALGEATSSALATWLATQSPTATALAVAAPFGANRLAAKTATSRLLTGVASAPGPRVLPNPLLTGALLNQLQPQREDKKQP